MRTLEEHLSQYAAYHRDRRNIATHFVGIPLIVLGVAIMLARPLFGVAAGIPLAPITFVALGATLFYLRLDLRFGLVMTLQMAAFSWLGFYVGAMSTSTWLAAGLGAFVGGWVIQFVGHYYEGKKPAFVDDLIGLLVGPLFITAEAAFFLGMRKPVLAAIEAKVGPTRINEKKQRATA